MGMHDQNGRGITGPGNGMRGPSWRPADQRDMRDDDDDDRDLRGHRDVRGRSLQGRDDDYGQGQSGYGAGRFADDRAMMEYQNRNQADRWGRGEQHERGYGIDERFAGGRGGEGYWLDRGDRPNRQWDHRDREYERHQRERMGYRDSRRDTGMETGYRSQGGMGTPGYSSGGHRGKGPMNYTRSDERIREQACEALTEHDEIDASSIDVTVSSGEVTLRGMVEDRHQKRLAEDVVERCAGVKDVSNQLKIGDQSHPHSAGNQMSTGGVSRHDKPRA